MVALLSTNVGLPDIPFITQVRGSRYSVVTLHHTAYIILYYGHVWHP